MLRVGDDCPIYGRASSPAARRAYRHGNGLADLTQLLVHYGTTSGAVYEDADLDGGADVDLTDLAALLGVYGTSCP